MTGGPVRADDVTPLPIGWGLALDPRTRRADGGRVLVGGSPFRILRLTAAGAALVDRLEQGEPVPGSAGAQALARRLLRAALANPRPAASARGAAAGAVDGTAPGSGSCGPEPADVTLVVPVRDDAAGLDAVLRGAGERGGTVVVDDGSADPATVADVAARHGAALVRHERSLGPGAARETGWRAAATPLVAFLDADCRPAPGWLGPLLAHLADPEVVAAAPRIVVAPGSAPADLEAYDAVRGPLDLGTVESVVRPRARVPYVPTAALVVRRDALEAVGGFDRSLRVGEDVDLLWRLAAASQVVRYEPAATVAHPVRPGLRRWLGQRVSYGTSAAALAARHGRAVAPMHCSGWSAVAWALVGLRRPAAAFVVAAGTTAALVPRLRALDHPRREALRIAGLGHLYAGRTVADAVTRTWGPVALPVLLAWRRTRPAALGALVLPALLDHRERRPRLGRVRWTALRAADDLAYGVGVWVGCLRARSLAAVRPAFTGPLPEPTTIRT